MQKKTDNRWWLASIVGEIGFLIAIPLVVFLLLGRAIDTFFHCSPLFMLVGILLAIGTSTYIVYRRTSDMIKEADKDDVEVKK